MIEDFLTEEEKERRNRDYEFEKGLLKVRQTDETGKNWCIFIGDRLGVDEMFKSEEEARQYIKRKPYRLIFAIIAAMIYADKQVTNLKEEENGNN